MTTWSKRAIGVLAIAIAVIGWVGLVIGARWGEELVSSDARRRVLVHPMNVGDSIRVPFYPTTDLVRIAVHGLGASGAPEAFADLAIVHVTARGERTERVHVELPTVAARTRLEERTASAWDSEGVNVDVAGEGPGEIVVKLERLDGASGAAVRAYRREPNDKPESGGRAVSAVELGELPELVLAKARRSGWHRAVVLTEAGGHPLSRAMLLMPPVPPPPVPPREHVVPARKRKPYRATPGVPVSIDASHAALAIRVGLRSPIDPDASDRMRFDVITEGGPIARPFVQSFDEVRATAAAAHYETGSPATEEVVVFLLVPRGAHATIRPKETIDVELREIDLTRFDRIADEDDTKLWLGLPRPPSNAREAAFEQPVLILDGELPILPPRVLARIEASTTRLPTTLTFASKGERAHVPVHVPRATSAVVVIDGGQPRRRTFGAVRRLTPGTRKLEVSEIADVLIGDDLAVGEHRLQLLERDVPMIIRPVLRLPPHWIEGAALEPEDDAASWSRPAPAL